ncbi:AbrB family transcriptional regulator [Geminicoccaceae bacterium 1502E]|nr:AbrB family transcriptional regulator [Geminicoccaceae bacterium 1502E]
MLAAVTLALAGGGLFELAGIPLPWMLGPMLATTLASMGGARITVPAAWRTPAIVVLGLLLGSSFTGDMLAGMPRWLPSLAALPLYILLIGLLALVYMRLVARIDPLSAYFCATPGGLGEMMILGDRMGGDMRLISLVHATRILLVVFIVPLAFGLAGFDTGSALDSGPEPAGALDLLVLLGCGVAGAFLGGVLRLPAPGLLGPMLASAAAHLAGLVDGAPPFALVAAAQLVIGATVGCRFNGVSVASFLWTVLTGLGLTILMLLVALLFGVALSWLTGLPTPLLILAYVPGGITEMSVIALSLTTDPAFVATHHIVRIGLVVLMAPMLFRLYRRWARLDG